MSKNQPGTSEFIGCTDVLLVKGHGYKCSILIRIELEKQGDGSIKMTSRAGHTGTRIKNVESIFITETEWDNRHNDPQNSLVLTQWVFSKAGWVYG